MGIDTECIGSCQSNYHTITTTTKAAFSFESLKSQYYHLSCLFQRPVVGDQIVRDVILEHVRMNWLLTFNLLSISEACSWRSDSTRCYPGTCQNELAAKCQCTANFGGTHCHKSMIKTRIICNFCLVIFFISTGSI
jgi:hypothetical protein